MLIVPVAWTYSVPDQIHEIIPCRNCESAQYTACSKIKLEDKLEQPRSLERGHETCNKPPTIHLRVRFGNRDLCSDAPPDILDNIVGLLDETVSYPDVGDVKQILSGLPRHKVRMSLH